MKFCDKCKNMLYIKINDEEKKLTYQCKNCGLIKDHNSKDIDNCIYTKNYTNEKISYKWMIHKDLCHDPTLPKVNNIPCPNDNCPSNKGTPKEVVYLKYDNENLKYIYMCCVCSHSWKHQLE